MKRAARDLVALGLASVVTAGLIAVRSEAAPSSTAVVPEQVARAEAAFYLDAEPSAAELRGQRWRVATGPDTAWIDASTGELVEIEFGRR